MQKPDPQLDRVIAALCAQRDALEAAGVAHLSVFGSTARGEPASDVDICVELDDAKRARGFAQIAQIEALRDHLRAILGRPVDLVIGPVTKPSLRETIEREGVRAF